MENILYAIIAVAGIAWIVGCFVVGRNNALKREKVCTEIVTAHINAAEDHRFFLAKYHTLSLSYEYNGKEYHVRKGWFRNEIENEDITLHINPANPEECYITTLMERCGIKK